jgi:hypothetical protein
VATRKRQTSLLAELSFAEAESAPPLIREPAEDRDQWSNRTMTRRPLRNGANFDVLLIESLSIIRLYLRPSQPLGPERGHGERDLNSVQHGLPNANAAIFLSRGTRWRKPVTGLSERGLPREPGQFGCRHDHPPNGRFPMRAH